MQIAAEGLDGRVHAPKGSPNTIKKRGEAGTVLGDKIFQLWQDANDGRFSHICKHDKLSSTCTLSSDEA